MKTIISVVCALLLFAGNAVALVIDFDDVASGRYDKLVFSDLTLTLEGGIGLFTVDSLAPGAPLSGKTIIRSGLGVYNPSFFNVAFNEGVYVNSFSVDFGDYGADEDNPHLAAYDAAMNLLSSDTAVNPAGSYTGGTLSVASTEAIAFVKFWDSDPFPGALYFDNMKYNVAEVAPVPEPSTVLLLAAGLLGLGYSRRNKKS